MNIIVIFDDSLLMVCNLCLGGRRAISDALQHLGVADGQSDCVSALPRIPGASLSHTLPDRKRIKSRRVNNSYFLQLYSLNMPGLYIYM